MHERVAGVSNRCRICDYMGCRLPCSLATLRDEAVLRSLNYGTPDEDLPDF